MRASVMSLIYPHLDDSRRFEDLCRLLMGAELNTILHAHGRPGQRQYGVDSYGQDKDLAWVGVQAKLRLSGGLTWSEIKEEIQMARCFQPKLRRYFILTTAPVNITLQEQVRKISDWHVKRNLFAVDVLSWRAISDLLDKHPRVTRQFYALPILPRSGAGELLLNRPGA